MHSASVLVVPVRATAVAVAVAVRVPVVALVVVSRVTDRAAMARVVTASRGAAMLPVVAKSAPTSRAPAAAVGSSLVRVQENSVQLTNPSSSSSSTLMLLHDHVAARAALRLVADPFVSVR
jgi:hypothetical protein